MFTTSRTDPYADAARHALCRFLTGHEPDDLGPGDARVVAQAFELVREARVSPARVLEVLAEIEGCDASAHERREQLIRRLTNRARGVQRRRAQRTTGRRS